MADEYIFVYMCFGPGKEEYLDNMEDWYKSNKNDQTKFVILQDSSLPAQKNDPLFDLPEKLKARGIEAEIFDIRKHHPVTGMNYLNWLRDNIQTQDGKPAYAFISDPLRFIGLKQVSQKYKDAQQIIIVEADTIPIENNWLENQIHTQPSLHDAKDPNFSSLKIFGCDRAIIISHPQSKESNQAIDDACRLYENIYEYILSRSISTESLGKHIPEKILAYNKIKDGPFEDYLGALNQQYQNAKSRPTLRNNPPDSSTFANSWGIGTRAYIDFYQMTLSEKCGFVITKEEPTKEKLKELLIISHSGFILTVSGKLYFASSQSEHLFENTNKTIFFEFNLNHKEIDQIKNLLGNVVLSENQQTKCVVYELTPAKMKKIIDITGPIPGGAYHEAKYIDWQTKTYVFTPPKKPSPASEARLRNFW